MTIIEEIQSKMKVHQDELQKLERDLLREFKINSAQITIEKQFALWIELDLPKRDYIWIQETTSELAPNLFEYGGPLDWNKYQTITIVQLADLFKYMIRDPDEYEVTIEHVHEWMKWLIKNDFKSMIYDW